MRRALILLVLAAASAAGEIETLREEIGGLALLNRLDLSQEQARGLLPIATRGAVLRRAYERDRDHLMVSLHAALVRFREEDLRDRGLSPDVMAAAGGTDHALKDLGSRLAATLAPLEEEAKALLTPAQRRLIEPETAAHPLDLLRTLHGSDFDELRDRLARSLARSRVAAQTTGNARRERLRIRAQLNNVRSWDRPTYINRRDELLDSLVPGRVRAKVSAEIRRIYRARYGRVGPLGDHLFRPGMLKTLAARAGSRPPRLPPLTGPRRTLTGDIDKIARDVAHMKAEINLLNLMNGLHLTRDQVTEIARCAKACAAVALPRDDEHVPPVASLRKIRDALEKQEPVPAGALQRVTPAWRKRGAGYLTARRREAEEARDRAVARLLGVLSSGQLDVISTYSPCLVPPKNLRDPVRVGQARDTQAQELLLDRVRAMTLGTDAMDVAEKVLRSIETRHGIFPPEERECRLMLLLGVAYEAQSLDDVAYVARKSELAVRLEPLYRLDTLKEKLHTIDGTPLVVRRKIAAFLLDPRIVPLAQDRLVRLSRPQAIVRPELPKAETCEEGECGKP